jgi:hypothetical protein
MQPLPNNRLGIWLALCIPLTIERTVTALNSKQTRPRHHPHMDPPLLGQVARETASGKLKFLDHDCLHCYFEGSQSVLKAVNQVCLVCHVPHTALTTPCTFNVNSSAKNAANTFIFQTHDRSFYAAIPFLFAFLRVCSTATSSSTSCSSALFSGTRFISASFLASSAFSSAVMLGSSMACVAPCLTFL